jgi:hypothetical protein
MMVTWADMIRVVSGMNDRGLTVTLNAARSSIPAQAAMPVTLLAREILQYASDIEEAYAISRKHRLFVSESLLIGSAKDGKTVIIEKSPGKEDLVYPESDRIICSNHYQGKVFESDSRNLENIRGSDSYSRLQRVAELLDRKKSLDVQGAVDVLRDQRGLGDSDVGMGNQLAINQLIAHHSVVFKPDSLMVWVSAGPWQEGKFVAYDLKKVFALSLDQVKTKREIYMASRTIAADTFINTSKYKNFLEYLEFTTRLHHSRKNKTPLPGDFDKKYIDSNPSLYLTYENLADYYSTMKMFDKASYYYNEALSKKLPGTDEKSDLTEKKGKLQKKLHHEQ